MANVLRPIAEKLRERVRFVMIDAVAYRKLTKTFGIDNGDTPTFAIKQLDGTRFMFDPKVELTSAAAESWVADYMDGKLSPYFKSEARPETQDGPVTVVVRDSFQEIVMESGKDVLLEFYAPWCGHCKKFVIYPVPWSSCTDNADETSGLLPTMSVWRTYTTSMPQT